MSIKAENILVIGAYGRLGTVLSPILEISHNIIQVGRNKKAQIIIESISIKAIESLLREHNVTVVINLIANTDVNGCENNSEKAFLANAVIPQYISAAVNNVDSAIFVIHISTDQVYSGQSYHKECEYNPCNVYGISKLSGEMSIANSINVCILRTNYFGFSMVENKTSYLDWLVRSIDQQAEITLFQNVFFTPIGCDRLCSIILTLLEKKLIGTYNLGSDRVISKAEFAEIVAKNLGVDSPRFIYSDYFSNSNVKRPLDMSMDSNRLLRELQMDPVDVKKDIAYELSKMAIS